MIMVTMAGMAILFGFVISYSDAYKKGVGSSVMESLTIEDVWIGPPSPPSMFDQFTQFNYPSITLEK